MNRVQAAVVTGFSFFFSLYQLVDKLVGLHRQLALLRVLSRAQVYRPAELLLLAQRASRGLWVTVEGLLKAENPVVTEDLSKFVYMITLLKEKSWFSSLSEIIVSQKQFAHDIYLQDPTGLAQLCIPAIKNADLTKSIERFSKTLVQPGTGRRGLLLLLLKLLIRKELDFNYLKGQSKIVENGIRDGSLLTVFGQLKSSEKGFRLENVQLVTRSKESTIKHLRLGIAKSALFGTGFFVLFLIASYFVVVGIANYLKERRKRDEVVEEVPEEVACIVCRQRARDILFEPCLHLCICKVCTTSLQRAECPICKSWIQKQVAVTFD
jgi:hypothetical protein